MGTDRKSSHLEIRITSDPTTEQLTSGDSGPLDLQLYRYLQAREEIVREELQKGQTSEKEAHLKEELLDLEKRRSLLVDDDKRLYGHCYSVSNLLTMTRQLSKLLPSVPDHYTKIERDLDYISKWDGHVESLFQKTSDKEKLEDIFERIFSFIIQQNERFMKSMISYHPQYLEIMTKRGILKSDLTFSEITYFFCRNADELHTILSKFSTRLLPESEEISLNLMPLFGYKYEREDFYLNTTGHKINAWREDKQIHIKDQKIYQKFPEPLHKEIAQSIFYTRQALYLESLGARGFLIKFIVHKPLRYENTLEIKESKKPSLFYPMPEEILDIQSPRTKEEKGSLLALALIHDNITFAHYLLQKGDIDINVFDLTKNFDPPVVMALKKRYYGIITSLLVNDADLYATDHEHNNALTLLLADDITLEQFIIYIPDIPSYHRQYGNELLSHLIRTFIDLATINIFSQNAFPKIYWLASKLVTFEDNNILELTVKNLFQNYLNAKNIKGAMNTVHYFNYVSNFDYRDFVICYLSTFPPEQQFEKFLEAIATPNLNKQIIDDILFFSFAYGLTNNQKLRDALFSWNNEVINLLSMENHSFLHYAVQNKDENAVLFLIKQENLFDLQNVYQRIQQSELKTTPKIKNMIGSAVTQKITLPHVFESNSSFTSNTDSLLDQKYKQQSTYINTKGSISEFFSPARSMLSTKPSPQPKDKKKDSMSSAPSHQGNSSTLTSQTI